MLDLTRKSYECLSSDVNGAEAPTAPNVSEHGRNDDSASLAVFGVRVPLGARRSIAPHRPLVEPFSSRVMHDEVPAIFSNE